MAIQPHRLNDPGAVRLMRQSTLCKHNAEKFYKNTVWKNISNTAYEGKIKDFGDTVYIRQVPNLNISNYVKGQNLVHQKPESTNVTLLIDKGKYFDFILDDVDKVQMDIDAMDAWSDDASITKLAWRRNSRSK